jgi:hypothetical protein
LVESEKYGAQQQPTVTHKIEHNQCRPLPTTLKCNIDVVCFRNANQFCIGVFIRDANGGFLKAFTKTLEGQPEIREADATIMLETLRWLQQYNMQMFVIETYCIQVIQEIEGKNRNNMEFGVIIENCKRLLISF